MASRKQNTGTDQPKESKASKKKDKTPAASLQRTSKPVMASATAPTKPAIRLPI